VSCNDLDRLRTESPQSGSSGWPLAARQHLQSCERCSQLQAVLDISSQQAVPEDLLQRIEAAVLPGLGPVSPLPGAWRVTVALTLAVIAVIAAANWRLGLAGWEARSSLQSSVDFALLGIGVLLLANRLAHQMAPGSRRGANVLLYLSLPVLALLLAVGSLFSDRWMPDFARVSLSCWTIGVVCAAASAPLFWLVLRRGLWLYPVGHGAVAGLLGGLVGVSVLEIYCPYLDRLHISVAHIGAAITSALVGAAVGVIEQQLRHRNHNRSGAA